MDIQHFALSRIEFISGFHKKTVEPFDETIRLIEEGKEPYEPGYSEDDEPQFLSEWIDASQSIDILGIQCASLLSSTLKLFFEESLNNVFRRNRGSITKNIKREDGYKTSFKKGWLNGYRKLFETEFGLDWASSAVNLDLIEELILVRNRGQHPEDIVFMSNRFTESDLNKIKSPFFIDETYDNPDFYDFLKPTIKPTPEKIRVAISEIIKMINWLEGELNHWGQKNA